MENIKTLKESINTSLEWVKDNKSEDYEQRFIELVGLRGKLRKIEDAETEKPAIAAFGESQKGKSYLIGNLLKTQKSLFKVKNEKGESVDFVDRVNPIGDNKEATGVVTRFSSFNSNEGLNRFHAEHPVIIKLFRVSSIAAILCDSYFKDLMDAKSYADDVIKAKAEEIYEKYSQSSVQQDILIEDDILDIKSYLSKYVTKETQGIQRSGYFDKLALVIRKVPQKDWASVLQYLWHENKPITDLFQRLVCALNRIDFSREVYVDFDAVMHRGDNKNTIMSVDCLNGLDDASWAIKTNVYVPTANGGFKQVSDFPKCELCALCAETVFKIEPEYLTDENGYSFDEDRIGQPGELPQETREKLPKTVAKNLLSDTDLLDFPGARNRLAVMEEFLTKMDQEAGASNLVQMLRRGKVAYLFNSYNDNRIINILLFCHDNSTPNVNEMYNMINDWVEKYVGASARLRQQTVERCGGISPLFVIGTKFNIDMIEKNNEDGDSDSALNGRWKGRFNTVLYTGSFKADDVDWFKNWDGEGHFFNNTYLLRDYKYSGCDGKGNNLYEGYNEKDENPQETQLKLTPDFYDRLRSTFIGNKDVRKFFEDPSLAWDVAATRNNDGSLYIIQRLTVVAKNMFETRKEQFEEEMKEIHEKTRAIMKSYFVTDNPNELLIENIKKANEIYRELDFVCTSRPDYFGHLLQALQMSEALTFKEFHSLKSELPAIMANSPQVQQYQLIRERCNDFKDCKSEEDKWMCFMKAYMFSSKDEAMQLLERKNIDWKQLFSGPTIQHSNSSVIANHMLDIWRRNINGATFINQFTGPDKMDPIIMSLLLKCITDAANSLKLADEIGKEISEYTDVLNVANINEDLIADIVATKINGFVMNFGFNYLSEDKIQTSKKIAADHDLNCFDSISQKRVERYDEAAITQLLDDILADNFQLPPSFMTNYHNWIGYMYVAFIANINIDKNLDIKANNKLKVILDELN